MAVTIFYKTNTGTYIDDTSWNLDGFNIVGASHTPDSNGYYSIGLNLNDVPDSFARGFSTLTEVKIVNDSAPSSGYTIGNYAFYMCEELKSVKITGNCWSLGDRTFAGCVVLNSVDLGNTKTLGQSSFADCYNLRNIILPDDIVSLGTNTFSGSGLESIYIPNDYCTITNAFRWCENLVEVDGVGGVHLMGTAIFLGCTSLQRINISNKTNEIEDDCFSGCISLKEIIIPSSITSLGYGAFYNCSSLEKITFLGSNAPTFKRHNEDTEGVPTFSGLKLNGTFYYPETNNGGYDKYLLTSSEPFGTGFTAVTTLATKGWNAETFPLWDIQVINPMVEGIYYENGITYKSLSPLEDDLNDYITINIPELEEINDYEYYGSLDENGYYEGHCDITIPTEYTGSTITANVSFNGSLLNTYTINVISTDDDIPIISLSRESINIPQSGGSSSFDVYYFNYQTINPIVGDVYLYLVEESILENGIKRTYSLIVGETEYKRTIPLKFSCLGIDGTSSASSILYINQDGSQNPDEDDSPVKPVWKDFIVSFDDDAEFILIDNNREFFKGHIYPKPNERQSKFYLNKIMQDYVYLKPLDELFFGSDVQYHNDGLKRIELKREGNNAISEYYFKYDYSYRDNNDLALTEFILPYFVKGQYVLLTFRNETTETQNYSYQIGGITTYVSINPYEYKTIKIYTGDNNQIIINGKQYPIVDSCKTNYVLYYLNSKGGWCSLPVEGRVTKRDSLNTFEFTRNYNNTKPEFGRMRYLSEYNTTYTFNTGWIKEDEVEKVVDMLESNMLYVHILDDNKIVPLLLDNTNVEYKKKSLQEKLLYYQFEATTAQSKVRL